MQVSGNSMMSEHNFEYTVPTVSTVPTNTKIISFNGLNDHAPS